jgi:hypothetical protein
MQIDRQTVRLKSLAGFLPPFTKTYGGIQVD